MFVLQQLVICEAIIIDASNQIQGMSHMNLNKNVAHIPYFLLKYL